MVPTATTFAAAAGLRFAECGAATGDVEFDRLSDRVGAFLGANLDADLLEAGEGTFSMASSANVTRVNAAQWPK